MDLNELIDKYIDKATGHIKKVSRLRPIKSKEEFFNILKLWRIYNKDNSEASIGDDSFGQSPHLWLSLLGKEYYLNSDSKGYGVKEFYQNRNNDWRVINNAKGLRNKVTNSSDGTEIKGFYFYKSTN